MEVRKNVVAAISAALQLYMQAEQQPLPAAYEERVEAPRPGPAFNAWAMSGRQAAMDMRRLWQMRLVR